MKIILDLNNVQFSEFLWMIAESEYSIFGKIIKEHINETPRQELVKKSDYLFSLLEDSGSSITMDALKETINYDNWGAPDYKEDGSDFWE